MSVPGGAIMRDIPLGTTGQASLIVRQEHLASQIKSALLPPVLATPIMILVMENAALNAYSIAATTPLSFGLHPGSRETQAPQKRKARILVVDDDPGLLRLLTIRLRAENYEVEAVESAAAALSACVRFRPDLVITDLYMPGMDGRELTRRLKQLPNPPVVVVATADDTVEARERCMAAGANAFLVKAGNLASQLLSAIQEFFPDDVDENDAEPKHFCERFDTAQ